MYYNLIKSAVLSSIVEAGVGDKLLDTQGIHSLIDGNIAAGITVLNSEKLCLEVDLENRIKVSGIYLYVSSTANPSGIKFQYKNWY